MGLSAGDPAGAGTARAHRQADQGQQGAVPEAGEPHSGPQQHLDQSEGHARGPREGRKPGPEGNPGKGAGCLDRCRSRAAGRFLLVGTGLESTRGTIDFTRKAAGLGADELVRRFEAEHDDYHAILAKALADRLAEAAAAWLHQRAREAWGIDEPVSADDLLVERHRGIRPAFGYPACPDHSEKFKLFDLLDAPAIGIRLTEHAAMLPAASVSPSDGQPKRPSAETSGLRKPQAPARSRRSSPRTAAARPPRPS